MILFSCLILLLSFFVSLILIRKVVKFAYNKRVFDIEDGRKIHHGNIPRVGGIAFVMAAMVAIFVAIALLGFSNLGSFYRDIKNYLPQSLAIGLSVFIIYFFGVVDDIKNLRYRTKFSYQILVGLMLCLTGFCFVNMRGVLGLAELPLLFGCVATVFTLVLIINAFNFIDGIDGLASGIALLSLIYYTVLFVMNQSYLSLFSLAFIGALLPFIYFNLFGKENKKNKTFMGDTGSTVLGLVLFVFAIVVMFMPMNNASCVSYNPFAYAFAPLLLPCYDVVNVVLYRLSMGRNPFKADNNHFHHKLIKLGLSQHKVLIIELIIMIFISSFTILSTYYVNINLVLFVSLFVWIMVNMILNKMINKKQ